MDLWRIVDRCERQFHSMSQVHNLPDWQYSVRDQRLEKAVSLSAFIVRKLMDSYRLSTQVEDGSIEITRYPICQSGRAPDSMKWDRIDKFYELDSGVAGAAPLRYLVNWIIHSFVFLAELRSDLAGGQVIDGFYVNSDRTRRQDLVRVSWSNYRRALDGVVNDDVVESIRLRNGRGDEVELRSAVYLSPADQEAFRLRHKDFIAETLSQWRVSSYGGADDD